MPGNLTPRGLVLNLGANHWVGYDVDLLRVSAIWQGDGVTPIGLASGSHRNPRRSPPGGQKLLPEPMGRVWLTNGIYPGWQMGERPSFTDPREPAPSPEEVGRGPLPESMPRLHSLRHTRDGLVLAHQVGKNWIREFFAASEHEGRRIVERHVEIDPSSPKLLLVLGAGIQSVDSAQSAIRLSTSPDSAASVRLLTDGSTSYVRIEPTSTTIRFCVTFSEGATAPARTPRKLSTEVAAARWPGEVTTTAKLSTASAPWVVDDFPLPLQNPWRRNVRLGGVQFFSDGSAAGVTVDGDVWRIFGLGSPDGRVRWRRFASGLHEPMNLAVRDDEIFVFDRNGIWKLRDSNGDGEADIYELFSNAFAQTADMREFPNGIALAPNGEFVVAKGGQQSSTLGKHNGSVVRVSADGRRATVVGYGFRQPFIGVNVKTGQVTASDQQGQYIPTTPLQDVRDGQFYGFLSDLEPSEKYPAPIAEPLVWLPHAVSASGASQVWLHDTRMGALDGALLHISFNRPELFRVLFSKRGDVQHTAVVSVTQDFDFPPLYGAVNPADRQLYVSGFQILGWGTTANRVSGLARLRYTGAPGTIAREILATDRGVLLRFDGPVDPAAAREIAAYRMASWHYIRSPKYGSPQLKEDGTAGIDWHAVQLAHLSRDKRSVLLAAHPMKPVMQLRVTWAIRASDGRHVEGTAYLSPQHVIGFDAQAEGFDPLPDIVATNAAPAATAPGGPVTAEEGRRLALLFGCAACHSFDGVSHASIGPTWRGLYGSDRMLTQDTSVKADDGYLRESIVNPAAKMLMGYRKSEYAMPSYAGVLENAQIDALVLFIKSLR